MKERLTKLLTVKSIVTIVLTVVFAVLAVMKEITSETFMVVYSTIIAFYFGTQTERKNSEDVSKSV